MEDLSLWKAMHIVQGCVLGGDLSAQPGEALREALAHTLVWHDALAPADGTPRQPTSFNHMGATSLMIRCVGSPPRLLSSLTALFSTALSWLSALFQCKQRFFGLLHL